MNLSPYEKNRIIPDNLNPTDLGKDLLGQDYTLKQLVSSLTYPDSQLGKKYWKKIFEEVYQLASTTNVPINTFNKVWIVPDTAEVYENGNVALITESKLKVLSEQDYLALNKQENISVGNGRDRSVNKDINKISSNAMKEIILPEIEWDINYGENFAKLRQMYNSLVLATWFKKKLKDSIYQYYIDQGKTEGIDLADQTAKEKIYNLYVESFKKGVYDYIKTDVGRPTSNIMSKPIRRRYHSGGMGLQTSSALNVTVVNRNTMIEATDDLLILAPTDLLLPDGKTISLVTGKKKSSSALIKLTHEDYKRTTGEMSSFFVHLGIDESKFQKEKYLSNICRDNKINRILMVGVEYSVAVLKTLKKYVGEEVEIVALDVAMSESTKKQLGKIGITTIEDNILKVNPKERGVFDLIVSVGVLSSGADITFDESKERKGLDEIYGSREEMAQAMVNLLSKNKKAAVVLSCQVNGEFLAFRNSEVRKFSDIIYLTPGRNILGSEGIDFAVLTRKSNKTYSVIRSTSSAIKDLGGIDLNPTKFNVKASSSIFKFDNISFETIEKLRTAGGLTFKVLAIQRGVKMENIVDPKEDKISYIPQ